VLARWAERNGTERERPRTAQSFCVIKTDIAAQGYDLSLNRYKEMTREEIEFRAPKQILADLAKLEEEIERGMKELERMLE
jgi:type I restriction enzyme M protein